MAVVDGGILPAQQYRSLWPTDNQQPAGQGRAELPGFSPITSQVLPTTQFVGVCSNNIWYIVVAEQKVIGCEKDSTYLVMMSVAVTVWLIWELPPCQFCSATSDNKEGIMTTLFSVVDEHSDGLTQERRNSSALALELCLSCTEPSIPFQWSALLWLCFIQAVYWCYRYVMSYVIWWNDIIHLCVDATCPHKIQITGKGMCKPNDYHYGGSVITINRSNDVH